MFNIFDFEIVTYLQQQMLGHQKLTKDITTQLVAKVDDWLAKMKVVQDTMVVERELFNKEKVMWVDMLNNSKVEQQATIQSWDIKFASMQKQVILVHLCNMDLYIIKMKVSGIMGCDHMCFKLVKILHFVDIIKTINATYWNWPRHVENKTKQKPKFPFIYGKYVSILGS
jgi:hypothetical protein